MVNFFKNNLAWRDGRKIILVSIILLILALFIYMPAAYVLSAFIFFTIYFFRNPERTCPESVHNNNSIVCPADGRVVEVKNLDHEKTGYSKKVSIFLSPLDVHVNWTPIAGNIESINYKPGKFLVAFLPKSSELNERNDVLIKDKLGREILVRQIAGTIARRICCWIKPEQQVEAGQKYGMIRFGSRVEIFLPTHVNVAVVVGQKVKGGSTVLGGWT